jgi:hypothetical protein
MSVSIPELTLSGEAPADAEIVLGAIRGGHVYSSIDALATPALISFTATSGTHTARMGERLKPNGPVLLRVQTNAPEGSSITVMSDGRAIANGGPPTLDYEVPPVPGVYRVEVHVARAPGTPPVPWIVSNPIYVGTAPTVDTALKPVPSESAVVYSDGPATNWRIEKSVRSDGSIGVVRSIGGTQLLMRYGLGGTMSESPYVAAVVESGSSLARFNGLMFSGTAMGPMRLRLQLRAPGEGDRRWGKSVYLDETQRSVSIGFDQLSALGTATGPPKLEEIRDLLFVVDTVNTKQGASGQLWLDDVRYVR